jgi:hypothetical protein
VRYRTIPELKAIFSRLTKAASYLVVEAACTKHIRDACCRHGAMSRGRELLHRYMSQQP